MGVPPWAIALGGILGLDKVVFEPASNIYKTVQGFRDDANASDAMNAIAKYQKASDLYGYNPNDEGYMTNETQEKVNTAKAKRLKELYETEASPVANFLSRYQTNPKSDFSVTPEVALAAQGIKIDTSNPYAVAAINEAAKRFGIIGNNTDVLTNYSKGERVDPKNIAWAEDPGKLKTAVEVAKDANEPAAQAEFAQKQAELEGQKVTVPQYQQGIWKNVASTPGLKFSPTDFTSMTNAQRELAEKTPVGPLQPYVVKSGLNTETGNMQNFALGPPKVVNSTSYTIPAKVGYPGAYPGRGGGGGGTDKRSKVFNANLMKAVNKMNTEWGKNGDSEGYQRLRRNVQTMINQGEKMGLDVDYASTGLEYQSNVPQGKAQPSQQNASEPDLATAQAMIRTYGSKEKAMAAWKAGKRQ